VYIWGPCLTIPLYAARERSRAARRYRWCRQRAERRPAARRDHGEGPLSSVAGAGTARTRTLVHRVGVLLERGVRPERILLLTFTRRSAQRCWHAPSAWSGSASRHVHGRHFSRHRSPAAAPLWRAGACVRLTIMDQVGRRGPDAVSRARLGLATARSASEEGYAASPVVLAPRQHRHSRRPLLREEYPQFVEHEDEIPRSSPTHAAQAGAQSRQLRRPPALLGHAAGAGAGARRPHARTFDHLLVDEYQGHQPAAGAHPARHVPARTAT